jgi:hypothetical protein
VRVNRQDEQEKIMKFRAHVEPPEPMRGLEVPSEVVAALGEGARPPVTITVNGHSWKSRVALLRGRHLAFVREHEADEVSYQMVRRYVADRRGEIGRGRPGPE